MENRSSCFKNPILQQYSNYLIIGICSIVALIFFPFLGSEVGMAFVLPTTTAGWIVWVATKVCVGTLNIVIFHSFIQQAKINAATHPNYIQAMDILQRTKDKEYIPMSPAQFYRKEYGIKGTTIFITSVLSAIALSQAILTFDLATFLTYLFTIIFGVIAGMLEMQKCYEWNVNDLLKYALYYEKKVKEEQEIQKQKEEEERLSKQAQIQSSIKGENNDNIQQLRIPQLD
jgi:hypothetical protein